MNKDIYDAGVAAERACAKIFAPEKDTKRRMIALTGKDQYSLQLIQEYLTSLINVFKVKKVDSEILTTDEFLDRIIKGDIIEASMDDESEKIVGTSKESLEPGFLYVGIYTPHQLSNLLECKDKNLEVLPVEIEMNPKLLLDNLCDISKSIYEACEKYMKIQDTYDGDEFLDEMTILWRNYNTNTELKIELENRTFQFHIKEFNKIHNLITDLDNFI